MTTAPAGGGRRLLDGGLGIAGAVAAGVWLAWNGSWLAGGRIPPSLLRHFTGFPVPTSGFTRSLDAAAAGRWAEALAWNPFTAVFLGLLAATAVALFAAVRGRRPLILSARLSRAWLGVLAVAWIVKVAQGPARW